MACADGLASSMSAARHLEMEFLDAIEPKAPHPQAAGGRRMLDAHNRPVSLPARQDSAQAAGAVVGAPGHAGGGGKASALAHRQ